MKRARLNRSPLPAAPDSSQASTDVRRAEKPGDSTDRGQSFCLIRLVNSFPLAPCVLANDCLLVFSFFFFVCFFASNGEEVQSGGGMRCIDVCVRMYICKMYTPVITASAF